MSVSDISSRVGVSGSRYVPREKALWIIGLLAYGPWDVFSTYVGFRAMYIWGRGSVSLMERSDLVHTMYNTNSPFNQLLPIAKFTTEQTLVSGAVQHLASKVIVLIPFLAVAYALHKWDLRIRGIPLRFVMAVVIAICGGIALANIQSIGLLLWSVV